MDDALDTEGKEEATDMDSFTKQGQKVVHKNVS